MIVITEAIYVKIVKVAKILRLISINRKISSYLLVFLKSQLKMCADVTYRHSFSV